MEILLLVHCLGISGSIDFTEMPKLDLKGICVNEVNKAKEECLVQRDSHLERRHDRADPVSWGSAYIFVWLDFMLPKLISVFEVFK